MRYFLILALTCTTANAASLAPSAKTTQFEPSLMDNCNGLSWKKTFDCMSLTSAIREQLKLAEKFDALARRTTDELERRAYEAEAAARRAGAAHLTNQFQKLIAK